MNGTKLTSRTVHGDFPCATLVSRFVHASTRGTFHVLTAGGLTFGNNHIASIATANQQCFCCFGSFVTFAIGIGMTWAILNFALARLFAARFAICVTYNCSRTSFALTRKQITNVAMRLMSSTQSIAHRCILASSSGFGNCIALHSLGLFFILTIPSTRPNEI